MTRSNALLGAVKGFSSIASQVYMGQLFASFICSIPD